LFAGDYRDGFVCSGWIGWYMDIVCGNVPEFKTIIGRSVGYRSHERSLDSITAFRRFDTLRRHLAIRL
jgi:hypothetical protein